MQIAKVNFALLSVCIFPWVQVLIQTIQRDHQVCTNHMSHCKLYSFSPVCRCLSNSFTIPTGLCWLLVLIFQELLVNVNLGRYFTICSCYSIAHRLVEPWHLIRFDTMLLLTWHYTCFGITHALALHMLWHYTCFL